MLEIIGSSSQPALRPGKIITLSPSVVGISNWQCATTRHQGVGSTYFNAATFLTAEGPHADWHPPYIPPASPVYVSGIIDTGTDLNDMEPVTRDPLGRVPVRLAFLPKISEAKEEFLETYDTNNDNRVNIDDFSQEKIAMFATDKERLDDLVEQFSSGSLDDPYPGREDEDLTPEELALRQRSAELRSEVEEYQLYLGASELDEADRDNDGVITARDTASFG